MSCASIGEARMGKFLQQFCRVDFAGGKSYKKDWVVLCSSGSKEWKAEMVRQVRIAE